MQIYAKLMDGQLFTTCASAEDTDLIAQITADGFKPYDDSALQPVVGSCEGVGDPLLRISKPDAGELQVVVTADLTPVDLESSTLKLETIKLPARLLAVSVPTYRDDGDRIVLEWETLENSPAKIAAEIARLQSELSDSDYKVIKSYEYALAGQDAPYDVEVLHSERQALRDTIDELESRLEPQIIS